MSFLFHRRGEEKLLSIWWFVVLGVVTVCVVGAVSIYYTADIDVRAVEADILSQSLVRCLTQDGILPPSFFSPDFDVFQSCRLSRSVFDPNGVFYFRISAFDIQGKNIRDPLYGGNKFYEKDCAVQHSVTAERFPQCVSHEITVFSSRNGTREQIRLEVVAGSQDYGKEVFSSG